MMNSSHKVRIGCFILRGKTSTDVELWWIDLLKNLQVSVSIRLSDVRRLSEGMQLCELRNFLTNVRLSPVWLLPCRKLIYDVV
jgi:hypothetical protein